MDDNDEFLRTECARLQRNDPTIRKVVINEDDWPEGYGPALGEALLHNTVVTELTLNVNEMVMIRWEEEDEEDIASAKVDVAPMVQYLSKTSSLQKMTLHEGFHGQHPVSDRVCGELVRALAHNQHIHSFISTIPVIPSRDFHYLLETTRSLRYLRMDVDCIYHWTSQEDCKVVAEAFGTNQSLEKIHLEHTEDETLNLIDDILPRLSEHPRLVHLKLEGRQDIIDFPKALPLLLQSNSPSKLSRVTLKCYWLSKADCENMHSAIRMNSILSRLRMIDCNFVEYEEDETALEVFIKTLQTTESSENGSFRGRPVDLSMVCHQEAFDQSSTAKVLDVHRTRPSRDVRVAKKPRLEEQCSGELPRSHSLLQLSELRFLKADEGDLNAIAQFLPHAIQLQKLVVKTVREYGDVSGWSSSGPTPHFILDGLRTNGSLHHVAIGKSRLLGKRRRRLIRAVTQRNRLAPLLLSKKRARPDDKVGDENDARVSLFPPLFAAVHPAWKLAPNSFLRGLLSTTTDTGSVGLS